MSFISPVATDASGNAKKTGGTQSLGKDDFLHLLVTKLQNQDPMKPMEDEGFIAQLAQFSSLEQMNNISDGITNLNKYSLLQMQSMTNASAANLIGKEVKADYGGVYLDTGKTSTISFTSPEAASKIDFTIKDASGKVVATITKNNPAAGVGSMEWDGTDDRGNRVDAGYYTVEATATRANGTTFKPALSLTGVVDNVTYRNGNAFVSVDGVEVPLTDITSVGA
jgi:flagellar basal-body rod modification protein FlgD